MKFKKSCLIGWNNKKKSLQVKLNYMPGQRRHIGQNRLIRRLLMYFIEQGIFRRGIQKICEAWRELGTPIPEYTVIGDDLTVKFTALKSAIVSDSKILKDHVDTLDKKFLH